MPQYRTAWLLPISQPPIRDAWLRTDGGRIVAFGHSRPGDLTAPDEIDLGQAVVLPGLVNAHTHLELSWMRNRIPETDDFPSWLRAVIALQRQRGSHAVESRQEIGDAIREARRFGTALVGDISNTLASSSQLIEQNIAAVVFHELIGFNDAPVDAVTTAVSDALRRLEALPATDLVRHWLAPHAPYSVSPLLFRSIGAALGRDGSARSSIHLGESRAETEFLQTGTGPWRRLLEELGTWNPSWEAPQCGPLEFLDKVGFLNDRLLVVHGVQFSAGDLARLADAGATLVTCPRGNLRTGAGTPPIADFYESGARVAVGTDSLASVPNLNLFAELAELRRLAPGVPARALVESATMTGARALGFEADFGTIDPGKRDRLIAVQPAGAIANAEEFLVSGIDADQIRWLSEA